VHYWWDSKCCSEPVGTSWHYILQNRSYCWESKVRCIGCKYLAYKPHSFWSMYSRRSLKSGGYLQYYIYHIARLHNWNSSSNWSLCCSCFCQLYFSQSTKYTRLHLFSNNNRLFSKHRSLHLDSSLFPNNRYILSHLLSCIPAEFYK
jgi:hypothetical protein